MTKKIDFTSADKSKYSGIIAGMENKRPYTRFDPTKEPPKEYRFTVRMPGVFGQFMNELAYQRRSTITAEFQRLVAEEIEKRPEIMESLDELNKARG